MENTKLGLDEMIQALRNDLESAQKKALGANFHLIVDTIQLELTVAIEKEGTGTAGIKFWVVDLDGEYKYSNEMVHKFTLTLKPESGKLIQVAAKMQQGKTISRK